MANHHDRAFELTILLHAVDQARTRLRTEVRSTSAFYPQPATRVALLDALEAYAAALSAAGWPMSYRLRDELFLYRRLSGTIRPATVE